MEHWLSFHVFRANDQDNFLLDCVRELSDEFQNENGEKSVFYLRHWERGPHIRVRVKCRAADKKRQHVRKRLLDYVTKNPSSATHSIERSMVRRFAVLEKARRGWDNWQPENAVVFTAYKPEIDRFAHFGMAEVERHFCRSSNIALSQLSSFLSQGSRVLAGIMAAIAGADAFELDESERRALFSWQGKFWLRYLQKDASLANKWMDEQLTRLRCHLAKHPVESYRPKTFLWYDEMCEIKHIWENAKGGCVASKDLRVDSHPLFLFGHLYNNRLGIRPSDEAFIFYALSRLAEV